MAAGDHGHGEEEPICVVGVDAAGRHWGGEAELAAADIVFASDRLADLDRSLDGRLRPWPKPFSDGVKEIARRRQAGERVAVLATGDPMHNGIGATLARALGPHAVRAHPAPSAFALAAARLGWPLEATACVSLHGSDEGGRGVASLAQTVAPGRRILALSRDEATPAAVARWLSEQGFGRSTVTVLECLGGPGERVRRGRADALELGDVAPLNTVAVQCVADPDAAWHPLVSGLPDKAFLHDGQLTKEEVRALTVARLAPRPGGTMWDIGAGSGSVGLEWLRLSPGGTLVAIEPKVERCERIAANAERFGLPVRVVQAAAPEGLDGLPSPDCVFIGGGLTSEGVVAAAWNALSSAGTLGANAVTLEGEAVLTQLHGAHGGRLTRLSVQRAEPVGPFRGWRPSMPVTLWSTTR